MAGRRVSDRSPRLYLLGRPVPPRFSRRHETGDPTNTFLLALLAQLSDRAASLDRGGTGRRFKIRTSIGSAGSEDRNRCAHALRHPYCRAGLAATKTPYNSAARDDPQDARILHESDSAYRESSDRRKERHYKNDAFNHGAYTSNGRAGRYEQEIEPRSRTKGNPWRDRYASASKH